MADGATDQLAVRFNFYADQRKLCARKQVRRLSELETQAKRLSTIFSAPTPSLSRVAYL